MEEDPRLGLLYEALSVHLNKKKRTQLANLVGITGALDIEEIQEDKTCTYLFEKLKSRQILTHFNATKLIELIKNSNITDLKEILVCLEKYQQDIPKRLQNEQKMEEVRKNVENGSIVGRENNNYVGRDNVGGDVTGGDKVGGNKTVYHQTIYNISNNNEKDSRILEEEVRKKKY